MKKEFLVAIDLNSNHKSPLEWLAENLLSIEDTVHLLTCLDSKAPTRHRQRLEPARGSLTAEPYKKSCSRRAG
jgi:hypothetical protein